MEQEKIWDKIANPWKVFRDEPFGGVVEFLKGKKGNILDLGCGSGRNFVKIEGKIYGVDFSRRMIEMARERAEDRKISVELFKSEAYKLPFEDNFFDDAVCIAVIHCIEKEENRKKAFEELFRVLKKGGEAMVTVWSRNEDRIKNKPKEAMIPWTVGKNKYMRYYYIYDQKEFEDLLKSVGFKIVSIKEDRNIVAIVKK